MKKLKMTRTLMALILAMVMAGSTFALAACGKETRSSKSDRKSSKTEDEDEDDEDEDEDDKESKKDKKKDSKKDKKSEEDDTADIVIEASEEFTGFSDSTIKSMAEQYEAMGYVVEPVTAADLGAKDYNYVEGFRMYLEEDPETFFGWAKFESTEDGIDYVNDVWIADCDGYIAHETYGYLSFFIDDLYGGSVTYDGLMEYVPYEGDGRENTASPEDFDDPEISALCTEYQGKGFKIEADTTYDNSFVAYGVNEDRQHIQVVCRKFGDKEEASKFVEECLLSMSTMELTFEDNDDGSSSFQIDDTTGSLPTFPIIGEITESGVMIFIYKE